MSDLSRICSFARYTKAALRRDGTVRVISTNRISSNRTLIRRADSWTDIVAVAAGDDHVAGLRRNGTAVAAGNNAYGQLDVGHWSNVVALFAHKCRTVGLRRDGTVVTTCEYEDDAVNEVSSWRDMVSVVPCENGIIGLDRAGCIRVAGEDPYGLSESLWADDVIAIDAGEQHFVALRKDGTLLTEGEDDFCQKDADEWTDIVAVSVGTHHTVGLKRNGTVVAAGDTEYGQCNVGSWTNVVEIYATDDVTLGRKADGTILICGDLSNEDINVLFR